MRKDRPARPAGTDTEALSGAELAAAGLLVGESDAVRRVQIQLLAVASTDTDVLILGECGTGKGLAARAIHALSRRHAAPFMRVRCAHLSVSQLENELVGCERGALARFVPRGPVRGELARDGSLHLDEIGDMPLEVQGALLELLKEGGPGGAGSAEPDGGAVRVIATTDRDLRQMFAAGRLRRDLYLRLQCAAIRLPPLRERREDIPLLSLHFLERMAVRFRRHVTRLEPEAVDALQAYDWPGNVRELERVIQRAVIACREPGRSPVHPNTWRPRAGGSQVDLVGSS